MTADSATTTPETSRRSWLVIAVLALCGTLVSLQQTMLLALLPELPELVGTTTDNASWLVTATLLAGAVATPIISRMADMYGKRLMISVTLGILVAGALCGSFTTWLPLLVLARVLQGAGMALVPVGIAAMRDELPAERLPLAVALMSTTLAIGAGAGLPLGGLLAETLDWHATFWVPGAAAALMLVVVRMVLKESRVRTHGTFDLGGAVLLSAALTALLLAISKGGEWGWLDLKTVLVGLLGALLLVAWIPLELRIPNPLVDIRTSTQRTILIANGASLLMGFGMFANMLVSTQQLQGPVESGYGLGLGVREGGVWMAPGAVAFAVMAPVSARMIRRWGAHTTLAVGAIVTAVVYALRVPFSGSLTEVVIGTVLVSVGTSLSYAALPTLVMQAVPVTETAAANGLNTLLRSVGTSLASALVAAIFAAGLTGDPAREAEGAAWPSAGTIDAVLWLAAIVCAVSALACLPLFREPRLSAAADQATARERLDEVARGTVVGEDGSPVAGAVVTLVGPLGQHVDWGRTDATGHYSVAMSDAERYLFVASAPGWGPESVLAVLDDERVVPPIVLDRPLRVTGTVLDPDGRPREDISVVLTRSSGGVVDVSRTAPDGRYVLPLPKDGQYVLSVLDRTSGAVVTSPVRSEGSSHHVDVVLPREPAPGQPQG